MRAVITATKERTNHKEQKTKNTRNRHYSVVHKGHFPRQGQINSTIPLENDRRNKFSVMLHEYFTMKSAVFLIGSIALLFNRFAHGAVLDDSFLDAEERMLRRESFIRALSLPYISCRPDAFPTLKIAGFCSDTANLSTICGGIEVSVAARACSRVSGAFCCYGI